MYLSGPAKGRKKRPDHLEAQPQHTRKSKLITNFSVLPNHTVNLSKGNLHFDPFKDKLLIPLLYTRPSIYVALCWFIKTIYTLV